MSFKQRLKSSYTMTRFEFSWKLIPESLSRDRKRPITPGPFWSWFMFKSDMLLEHKFAWWSVDFKQTRNIKWGNVGKRFVNLAWVLKTSTFSPETWSQCSSFMGLREISGMRIPGQSLTLHELLHFVCAQDEMPWILRETTAHLTLYFHHAKLQIIPGYVYRRELCDRGTLWMM